MTGPRLTPEEIERLYAEYQASKQTSTPAPTDPFKPTNTPRVAAESSAMQGPGQAPARAQADKEYVIGLLRQAGQGATFGFADEGEAAVRSLGGRPYRALRDEVRQANQQFLQENPKVSMAAQLGGGILAGGALGAAAKGTGTVGRVLTGSGLAPKADATMTLGQRLLQSAKVGGAAGALGGAGMSDETDTGMLGDAALGGTIGAGAGLLFGAAAETLRGGRNLAARIGQGQEAPGAIRRAIRADDPETSAAKRVLQRIGNQRMDTKALAERSAAADGPDILAEVIGGKGVRDVRAARGLGYDAPDMIENSLLERARNDVGNVRRVVRTELGEQLDDVALKGQKVAEAQQAAGPLYDQALDGVTIADPRLVDMVKRPAIRNAYATARRLAANDGEALPPVSTIVRNAAGRVDDTADDVIGAVSLPDEAAAPELPTLTGRQVQYIKHALDDQITKLEGRTGGTSTKEYAQLVKARGDVDALLYEFANQGEDGASLWGAANREYAKPMQELDAFNLGKRSGRQIDKADVVRMLSGQRPEWTARGVANTIQDDLGRMGDGTVGPLRDPAPALMGSDAARARLEVAAGGDVRKVQRIQDAARNASRRLKTRQTVIGNSQTAEKLADQAEMGMDPTALLQGARSPGSALLQGIGRGAAAVQRNVIGQDMDALARLLMAGAPGQMTRQEAIASLQRMEPMIVQQLQRQLLTRGAIGGTAGRAATGGAR